MHALVACAPGVIDAAGRASMMIRCLWEQGSRPPVRLIAESASCAMPRPSAASVQRRFLNQQGKPNQLEPARRDDYPQVLPFCLSADPAKRVPVHRRLRGASRSVRGELSWLVVAGSDARSPSRFAFPRRRPIEQQQALPVLARNAILPPRLRTATTRRRHRFDPVSSFCFLYFLLLSLVFSHGKRLGFTATAADRSRVFLRTCCRRSALVER
ncbi:hypothetical protein HPB50_015724 [Hyalomma asiaticum]|uniref:Uncharacterized protein n=1 Tax=Hyalomma asiaticum TaxID=266040 RepID=A0ACB7T111_HYAAI|nr:hypothetical protein HPB50_015724 [Hyalomma asiaticum]